jgi:hypothetical protein
MTRLLFLPALLLTIRAVSPACVEAQARPPVQLQEGRKVDDLKSGARLRLSIQGGDPTAPLDARFRGFGATTMIIEVNGAPRELPMSSILSIEESYRDRKRAALVGVLTAVVGVYVWDFFGPHPRYTDQDKRYKENVTALAISVPAGALIGGVIGWHRWRQIGTSSR